MWKANQASEGEAETGFEVCGWFSLHCAPGRGRENVDACAGLTIPKAGSPTHLEVGEPDFTFAAASTCVSAGVTLSHL